MPKPIKITCPCPRCGGQPGVLIVRHKGRPLVCPRRCVECGAVGSEETPPKPQPREVPR